MRGAGSDNRRREPGHDDDVTAMIKAEREGYAEKHAEAVQVLPGAHGWRKGFSRSAQRETPR